MKDSKKISPPEGRLQQADCPFCEERRKLGHNFCGRCGKQLKVNPVIRDYRL